jgi:hypothetical protein
VRQKQHILDNKCSNKFKATIKKNHMTYQLVPPHNHQQNMAKKAILTFKVHFISILCGADKDFSLHLWNRVLPQTEHAINMLRIARLTPAISELAYLCGEHNYNANPFSALGCKVDAQVTLGVQETCATHTAHGYYIGITWEHYWCHEVYISATKGRRVCKTSDISTSQCLPLLHQTP